MGLPEGKPRSACNHKFRYYTPARPRYSNGIKNMPIWGSLTRNTLSNVNVISVTMTVPNIRSSCKRVLVTSNCTGSGASVAPGLNISSVGDVKGHDHHHGSADHQHSEHSHSHYPESNVSRFFHKIGLLQLASTLAHSGRWTLVSILGFLLALILSTDLSCNLLGPRIAHVAHAMALSVTFLLSGLPQTVEAACVAGSGQLDTHVLMSLAVFGTLTLGMAQEVRRSEERSSSPSGSGKRCYT